MNSQNFDKYWTTAYEIFNHLTESKYAVITRESDVYPGQMVGCPVKILRVDPPKESFRNANLPYVSVHVQMPNGETRNIGGNVLKTTDRKPFDIVRRAMLKVATLTA